MRRGAFDENAATVAMDAIDATGTLVPGNMGESNAQAVTLEQLDLMHDARQRRIAINRSGVSWFEWLVLLVGAACVICFCWLFGLRNPRTQLLMTSTVVTVIVSILVLLFELQQPFRSDVGIGPDAWEAALTHIHQMQTGEMTNMRMWEPARAGCEPPTGAAGYVSQARRTNVDGFAPDSLKLAAAGNPQRTHSQP